jgi:hypothetical protein
MTLFSTLVNLNNDFRVCGFAPHSMIRIPKALSGQQQPPQPTLGSAAFEPEVAPTQKDVVVHKRAEQKRKQWVDHA